MAVSRMQSFFLLLVTFTCFLHFSVAVTCSDGSTAATTGECPVYNWYISPTPYSCIAINGDGTQPFCGATGSRHVDIECRSLADLPVNSAFCDQINKPLETVECQLPACIPGQCVDGSTAATCPTYTWHTGDVNTYPCLGTADASGTQSTCGTVGTRHLNVYCADADGFYAPPAYCAATAVQPATTAVCTLPACAEYNWLYATSTTCTPSYSRDCGPGFNTKRPFCAARDSTVEVAAGYCTPFAPKPVDLTLPCAVTCLRPYSWGITWRPCTCSSTQTAIPFCYSNNDGVITSSTYCFDVALPSMTQACVKPVTCNNCKVDWFWTEWRSCSVECGGGTQNRDVSCMCDDTIVDESNCFKGRPLMPRPYTSRVCGTNTCAVVHGDPEFTGFNQQKYEIHGVPDAVFNIITSPYVQYNALFKYIGRESDYLCNNTFTAPWTHAGTYLGTLALKVGKDRIELQSGNCVKGITSVKVNDKAILVGTVMDIGTDITERPTGRPQTIDFADPFNVRLSLLEVDMVLTNSDNFFNQAVKMTDFGRQVLKMHGLLGQTWRTTQYIGTNGGKKFIEGSVSDYMIQDDDLFGDDFKFNKYPTQQ